MMVPSGRRGVGRRNAFAARLNALPPNEADMALLLPDDELAERIRACVLELLIARGPGRSICPSEAARMLAMSTGAHWQDLMRPVRTVAAAMAEAGAIEVLQHESVVDIGDVRGPVRLRLHALHGERKREAAA
ncbi:MAG TPA: DUF3253 domain-containing protein [Rhodanobacteraceae bacterium]|jgi:hypothetical protein|nr:DUF3253 domain-containing protein [Rhodanobacteraceae bacterium]